MTKIPFVNKFGAVFFYEQSKAKKRECSYSVVIKDNLLLCQYDKILGLYSFPKADYLALTETPSLQYTLHADVEENGEYFCETQLFDVYDVENAQINSGTLSWQLIEDVMVGNVQFDDTLQNGFRNMIVRMRK